MSSHPCTSDRPVQLESHREQADAGLSLCSQVLSHCTTRLHCSNQERKLSSPCKTSLRSVHTTASPLLDHLLLVHQNDDETLTLSETYGAVLLPIALGLWMMQHYLLKCAISMTGLVFGNIRLERTLECKAKMPPTGWCIPAVGMQTLPMKRLLLMLSEV